MRHYRESSLLRQFTDTTSFRQTTDAPDVRLYDFDLAPIHQIQKLEPGREPLAGCNRDGLLVGEPGITRQVISRQGCLDKKEIKLFPISDGGKASVRVGESVLYVYHKHKVLAYSFTHRSDHLRHPVIGGLQSFVSVRSGWSHFELGRREATSSSIQHPGDHGVAIGIDIRDIRLQRRIRSNCLAGRAAQKLVTRLAERLAAQVMQCHIQGPNSIDDSAPPSIHCRTYIELLPQTLNVQRVFTKKHFGEPAPHGMGPGSFDAGARDPWVHIRFTNSGNSVISMNLNHNVVLRRTSR